MRTRQPLGIGILLLGALLSGCGGGSGSGSGGNNIQPVLSAPTFSPAPGAYTSTQNVALADGTASAAIYYTTDGTTPTTASKLYSSAIAVSSTTTISAIATASGYSNSTVVQGVYTITAPPAATPTFSPAPGAYSAAQNVALADSTAGAAIYYTTNGTTPTAGSQLYSSPIAVSSTTTIEAIAVASGYSNSAVATGVYTISLPAAEPTITTTPAQNGAEIVSLATTTPGATIYYTWDSSTPTTSSQIYEAPFLVASELTVNAIAVAPGASASSVASQSFSANIASGTLVWSDEFTNTTSANAEPNPVTWTYDTGGGGWGNGELEDYCGWGSNASPCSTASPNAYVGTDGYLHIVAEQPSAGVYTSARLKTEGLFSFLYGRLEFRAQIPEGQGFWPAEWLLGNNIALNGDSNWPGCGEMDVQERVDAAQTPDVNSGSIHGTGFTGSNIGAVYDFPAGETAAGWHTYGMIWGPESVAYYIDDPTKPYATFTPASISGFGGSVWPFDAGPQFIIMNVAVGGGWPGNPNSSTPFPSQMVVDYVRIYAN
jgi:beta-glucanase (GH16 family)